MKLPSHTNHIKGNSNGPCVVIMGGLHGNEPIGVMVIEALKKLLKPQKIKGEIYLILGNPQAYKANKRFIDCDLNRIFHLNFGKKLNTEEKRALEIAPILKKANYLLDIHSTQKPSIPFIYTAAKASHFKLAKIFATKFIVSGSKKFKNKKFTVSTDNFVDKHGGIGITYESGWNEDLTKLSETLEKTKEFLNKIKVAFINKKNGKSSKAAKTNFLEVQQTLIPKSQYFKFTKDYTNFDIVKSGKTIAKEQNKSIRRPYDCYIVFPKKDIQLGRPVCYLAKKKNYV